MSIIPSSAIVVNSVNVSGSTPLYAEYHVIILSLLSYYVCVA
jgi:hypothetical protein